MLAAKSIFKRGGPKKDFGEVSFKRPNIQGTFGEH
jgi:hypothetical protein